MLYGNECVLPLVKCNLCQLKAKEVKILLCGHFCNDCVVKLTKNANVKSRKFKCESCHEDHTIPKNGFKNWEALNEFYSKQLNLENIYRGESAEKLKIYLKSIKENIADLDYNVTNIMDAIKEHCQNVRNKVFLKAEVVIKQVQDIRDEMIEEINVYQANSILHIEMDKIQKQKFIDKMQKFHEEWSEYLKRYEINESEMEKANGYALGLEDKIKKEKRKLENLIFNNTAINFRMNQINIERTFLGNFDYKTIDLNQTQTIKLRDIILNLHSSYDHCIDFDLFENGKISVVYPNKVDQVVISVFNKDCTFFKSSQTPFYISSSCCMRLKTSKDLLVFYLYDSYCQELMYCKGYTLALMNSNLESMKYRRISFQVISLDVNETNISCFTNESKIIIFDHKLNMINSIGQSKIPESAFYLTNQITQISQRNNKFYCLYPDDKLEVIDGINGDLLKSISIQGNKMTFDSKSNLWVLSISSSKIFKYDLDAHFNDEIQLENVTKELEFLIDLSDEKFYFYNFGNFYYLN